MPDAPDILCIGSVLWDIIGRTALPMRTGADVPGRISRLPGGVAMNIAMTLARFGMRPGLLTSVGRDAAGDELLARAQSMGLETEFVYRPSDLPTDVYMAIESPDGLVAAIADAHSLEAAGDLILGPLADGRLASAERPWRGPVALDGNLTLALLTRIANSPLFAAADLRVAPASPGKAERLAPLLAHPGTSFYVNLEEAGILCGRSFDSTASAAAAMVGRGARRALVTNGPHAVADGAPEGILIAQPPPVTARRVTGAGDTFMAAHIVAEGRGLAREAALAQALATAAAYVGSDVA